MKPEQRAAGQGQREAGHSDANQEPAAAWIRFSILILVHGDLGVSKMSPALTRGTPSGERSLKLAELKFVWKLS